MSGSKHLYANRIFRAVAAVALLAALSPPAMAVRVAVVKSWRPFGDELPVIEELNENWAAYGDIRVIIDVSLQSVESFTYADLVAGGADVLWLSNPAGGERNYTEAEMAAISTYAEDGHAILGTYRVFQYLGYSNGDLAPVFGLPDAMYNSDLLSADQTFTIVDKAHPLFRGIPAPYPSGALSRAQAPADDASWDAGDFGAAQVLASTPDNRGVITWYETEAYHAVYVSEFVEYFGNAFDTQLLYNALTLDAPPTGECCGADGGCAVVTQEACAAGTWSEGGTCDPNPCPQPGACCAEGGTCLVTFEAECSEGAWIEGADCATDSDGDGAADACDRCEGFDDAADADLDGVPDGCDRCEGFDDALDDDGDTVPNDCDVCPDSDDSLDADADGVPDGCDDCPGFDDNVDCDDDGVPDGCDTEPDCNGNGAPDNCDLADGLSEDCDEDGVPDECQPDTDHDGIIDECDDCEGDDALIDLPCDSEIDPDDCVTGLHDCSSGVLICTDDDAVDDEDFDGDGVYFCNDLCPDTPDGAVVLPNGCRPRGACCFDVDVCFDGVPLDECDAIGGGLLGDGFTCDGDPDEDGVAGCEDECPMDPEKSQPGQCGCGNPETDSDGDGTADCVDLCPEDPAKTEPGVCGCGVPDDDSDDDGTLDCQDGCPFDPDKVDPGICGCGVPDSDSDDDGTVDCEDGCPLDPLKVDAGICGCGIPDDDSDKDGTADCEDGCPTDPDKVEPGICGCGVPDSDSDEDGTVDCEDGCPTDPLKVDPGVCGCGVPDSDSDGDGVLDCEDLCPDTPPDIPVDADGCPRIGACCFRVGVCLDDAFADDCAVVGGFYQGNGSTCDAECNLPHDGDFDGNGFVDLDDFANWPGCMSGPDAGFADPNCGAFDFDLDAAVDLRDFAAFQTAFAPEGR